MKVIELTPAAPSLNALLDAVEHGDVVLVRDGRPLVRVEKFNQEDLEDWKYEHSAEAIALGKAARKQYREGKFRPLTKAKKGKSRRRTAGRK